MFHKNSRRTHFETLSSLFERPFEGFDITPSGLVKRDICLAQTRALQWRLRFKASVVVSEPVSPKFPVHLRRELVCLGFCGERFRPLFRSPGFCDAGHGPP